MTQETHIEVYDGAIDIYQEDIMMRFISLSDTKCRMIQRFENDVITIDLEV